MFEVLRSEDGRNFSRIAVLPGAGNSQTERSYQYLDENPVAGLSYYRLSLPGGTRPTLLGGPCLLFFQYPDDAVVDVFVYLPLVAAAGVGELHDYGIDIGVELDLKFETPKRAN